MFNSQNPIIPAPHAPNNQQKVHEHLKRVTKSLSQCASTSWHRNPDSPGMLPGTHSLTPLFGTQRMLRRPPLPSGGQPFVPRPLAHAGLALQQLLYRLFSPSTRFAFRHHLDAAVIPILSSLRVLLLAASWYWQRRRKLCRLCTR